MEASAAGLIGALSACLPPTIHGAIGADHRQVEVDGHRMSVAVQGSGSRTIVLLPG